MRLLVYGRFGSFCLLVFHDLFFLVFYIFCWRSFVFLHFALCVYFVFRSNTHTHTQTRTQNSKNTFWMLAHLGIKIPTIENHHFCTSFSHKISINHLMFVHFSHWFSHLYRFIYLYIYACVCLVYWHFPSHIRLQFICRMFMILLSEYINDGVPFFIWCLAGGIRLMPLTIVHRHINICVSACVCQRKFNEFMTWDNLF